MKKNLVLYISMLVIFLAIDMIWLTLVASAFYKQYLGYLMAASPNLLAAGIFYLIFILAAQVLIVNPGLQDTSWQPTFWKAALFGLVSYSTYDLTNLATVKDWPLIVTLVDLLWGTIVSTVVSVAGHFIGKKLM